MMIRQVDGTFLSAAVTISSGTTLEGDLVGGSDFTSEQIDVTSEESIAVTLQATGANAGMTGSVFVDFVAACQIDSPLYDTANHLAQVFATLEIPMTTNAAERVSRIIGVEGLAFIGIGRLRNNDPAFSADAQVYWGKFQRL